MRDGKVQGELKCFTPVLSEPLSVLRLCKKRTRNSLEGIQVVSKVRARSLDVYRRSFLGALPKIWSKYGPSCPWIWSGEVRDMAGSR